MLLARQQQEPFWQTATLKALEGGILPLGVVLGIFTIALNSAKTEVESKINGVQSDIKTVENKIDQLIYTVSARLDNQDDKMKNFEERIDLKMKNFTNHGQL